MSDDEGGGGLDEGMPVEARYHGGRRYFKGTITRKRANGTFDILYDDGEKEQGVSEDLIKSSGGGVNCQRVFGVMSSIALWPCQIYNK